MKAKSRAGGFAMAIVSTVVIAGVVLWITRERTTGDAVNESSCPSSDEAARESPGRIESPESPTREREAGSETDDHDRRGGESAIDADEKRLCPIDGILILVDAKGNQRTDADGEVVTLEDNRWDAPPVSVPITKGRFHVEIRDGHRLHIHGIELEGHLARPDREEIRWRDGPTLTLRARSSRPCLLHCVDAVTGVELTGVTLVEDDDDHAGEITPDEALVYGATSPIWVDETPDLKRVAWSMKLRALAAGCADCYVDTDFRFGGEVFLPMSRAAGLRVTVKGFPEGARLRVVRTEELPHQARTYWLRETGVESARGVIAQPSLDAAEPISLPSIPAGDYDVSVVPAGGSLTPTALVHLGLTLAPGKTEEITLECPETRVDAPVSISGTIEVPRGWGDAPFNLVLLRSNCEPWGSANHRRMPSQAMTRADDDPRIYRWTATGIHPATYTYAILELGCGGEWTIGSEGRSDLRIVVEPCARVTFHLIDIATGAPVDWYCVEWAPEAAGGGAAMTLVGDGEEPEGFAGRVPVGRGRLENRYDMQVVENDPIDIRPGSNDFTRHVRPLPGIRFELACEDWHVPWPVGERCRVTAVDHHGEFVDEKTDAEDDRLLLVSEAGGYRITLPAVYGFERTADFDVEIPDGKPESRRIELKRRQ